MFATLGIGQIEADSFLRHSMRKVSIAGTLVELPTGSLGDGPVFAAAAEIGSM